MSYQIVLEKAAIKDLKKLPPITRERIKRKLVFFSQQANPLDFAVPLVGDKIIGDYRFRVSDYRLLCIVAKRTITILSIEHRREVYRRK